MESQAESLLTRQIERLDDFPDLKTRMQSHLQETKVQQQRLDTPKLALLPPGRISAWVPGVAQEIRRTSKVASSRKFPPQKAVTCCMMAR